MKKYVKALGFLVICFNFVFPFKIFADSTQSLPSVLKIDCKISLESSYLKLNYDGNKINDSFDAVSGASLCSSTRILNSFVSDSSSNVVLPKSFVSLLLFAVSKPEAVKKDSLLLAEENGLLKVSFVHRNVQYVLYADESGVLDLTERQNVAGLPSVQTDEKNMDEEPGKKSVEADGAFFKEKEPVAQEKQAEVLTKEDSKDGAPFKAEYKTYKGKMKLKQNKGVIYIKGTLKLE